MRLEEPPVDAEQHPHPAGDRDGVEAERVVAAEQPGDRCAGDEDQDSEEKERP
jgi:hypothetical protein